MVGVANCIEAVLPGMLARGRGHIVVTSSLAAWRGLPGAAAYCAAKAALTAMTESLRIDLAPRGIDVTVLAPGFVRTKPGKGRKPFQVGLEQATARYGARDPGAPQILCLPLAPGAGAGLRPPVAGAALRSPSSPAAGAEPHTRRRDLANWSNATASTMITPMMICWT